MKQQDTMESIEKFTDKYLFKLPDITVVEYAVLAAVCFFIVRRLSWWSKLSAQEKITFKV